MGVPRTAVDAGEIIRTRRELFRLAQEDIPGVSSSTVRKIENGTAEGFRRSSIVAFMRALKWPADGYDRIRAGDDPDELPDVQPAEDDVPAPARIASIIIELPDGTKVANISPDQIEAVMRGLQRLADGDPEEGQMAAKDTGLPEGKRVTRPSPEPEE